MLKCLLLAVLASSVYALCCRAKVPGFGQAKVSSNVLKQVEQTDLIQYGLIPEFVGRFPIISSLQVSRTSHSRRMCWMLSKSHFLMVSLWCNAVLIHAVGELIQIVICTLFMSLLRAGGACSGIPKVAQAAAVIHSFCTSVCHRKALISLRVLRRH